MSPAHSPSVDAATETLLLLVIIIIIIIIIILSGTVRTRLFFYLASLVKGVRQLHSLPPAKEEGGTYTPEVCKQATMFQTDLRSSV